MQLDLEGHDGRRAEELEWLEADGLGGFASGTACGLRTRRYHGLLAVAKTPPTRRTMLVSGFEVELDLGQGARPLSAQRYLPDVTHPDGLARLVAFEADPAPTWTHRVDGVELRQCLMVLRDRPAVALRWELTRPVPGARLRLRPLLAARDIHDLQRERNDFRFDAEVEGSSVSWTPFPGEPRIVVHSDAVYRHEPLWYRNFLYTEERARGYGSSEDLASPGILDFSLTDGEATLVLCAEAAGLPHLTSGDAPVVPGRLFDEERARRATLASDLDRAADAYVVRRGDGRSVVAGYPWFTDWGRDTFQALRGLCLARGRLDEAGSILAAWSETVSRGMLPNRFVDADEEPEFNAVDASLWYVVAVGEYLAQRTFSEQRVKAHERQRLEQAVAAILDGYARGTRFSIHMDADGLLAAGEPGWQLTWMDARVDGQVVTRRSGKPVEIQALWAAALAVGARFDRRWKTLHERVRRVFPERFWNASRGYLNDVVDVDHVAGSIDDTLRPNQALAVGGLGTLLLDLGRARRVVDTLEARLWTPLGLRTLPQDHADYRGVYTGDPGARDRAYHQGTAWPWLLGPFVEAWVRVRGSTAEAKAQARERFLAPLHAHLADAGIGHVSEIVDGDAPHAPRGAPFQAWSMGELLRLERVVLATHAERGVGRVRPVVPAPPLTPLGRPGG